MRANPIGQALGQGRLGVGVVGGAITATKICAGRTSPMPGIDQVDSLAGVIVKSRFRHNKLHYRGLHKNTAQRHILFASTNPVIIKKALLGPTPAY
jgi:hypothetical protein